MSTDLKASGIVPGDLGTVDAEALRGLAACLWDDREAIAVEWTRRLVELDPRLTSGEIPIAALTGLNQAFLTLVLQQARDGDLDSFLQSYYEMNYRLIEVDLQRAPGSRLSLTNLYNSARISAQVIESYLQPAPHQIQLAWGRLSTRLAMIVGLAYSDCREEHIQQNFAHIQTLSTLFQGVLESAPDALVIVDESNRIVLVNPSAEQLFGYSREALRDKPLDMLLSPPEPPTSGLALGLHELIAQRHDGRQLPVEVRSNRLDTEQGTLTVHAIRDISERYQAAADLLRAHEQLEQRVVERTAELSRTNQTLRLEVARRQAVEDSLRREKTFADTTLDSLPGIFYLFDTQGRFLRWNRNFETVSGFTGEEIQNMHPVDFFADEEKQYIAERIAAVFETGMTTAEASFVTKDGRRIPHFFTGLCVVGAGVPCLIGMGIDISERKRMEEALRASSAELARTNQIKTYFAATISHELRNTFNGIMISNELILADSSNRLPAEHRDLLKTVQKRVLEAIQIIHATLELTRSEMQPGTSTASDVDVIDVLKELSREVASPRGDVVLSWDVTEPLPPLYSDPVKLKMIVKNLVENAIKFTPQGRVDVTVRFDDGVLCCSISDTGVGIPATELPRIFEPFHQGQGHDPRRRGGAGLGLYIVRRLVDLLGGTIRVDSVQGVGTRFELRLPQLPQAESDNASTVATAAASNR
ncbi:MAG TPA: PAS domain S-box protein [Candidatus Acidoferrales bacterium]|nr:PAS domain S-box protein [Candidatus Acidoferrales bacterium]